MKLGVSSYSFSKLVNTGKMSQMDVVSKAKEMGFDILEFSTISVPEGKTLPEFAAELRAECDRVGMEVGNYTIGSDFINGCDEMCIRDRKWSSLRRKALSGTFDILSRMEAVI